MEGNRIKEKVGWIIVLLNNVPLWSNNCVLVHEANVSFCRHSSPPSGYVGIDSKIDIIDDRDLDGDVTCAHPLFSNPLFSTLPRQSVISAQSFFVPAAACVPSRPFRSPLPRTTSIIPRQRLSRRLLLFPLFPPCASPEQAALLPYSDPGCLTVTPVVHRRSVRPPCSGTYLAGYIA